MPQSNQQDSKPSAPQTESVRYLLTDECNRQDHNNCPRSNDCRCTCHPSVPAGKDAAREWLLANGYELNNDGTWHFNRFFINDDEVDKDGYSILENVMHRFAASETAALRAERDKLDLALQSLTPGGSEFVRDPNRCVEFAQSTRDSQHRAIVSLSLKVKELEREIKELRAQRCRMCGETDPSKNEVNCPAKWHWEVRDKQ